MLPDDIYEIDVPMRTVDKLKNTAALMGNIVGTMALSSAIESPVPLNDHSSGQGKKYIIVTFISELTREETIRVLKNQANRWGSGVSFVKAIEEKI